jgi:hypothetical protein
MILVTLTLRLQGAVGLLRLLQDVAAPRLGVAARHGLLHDRALRRRGLVPAGLFA